MWIFCDWLSMYQVHTGGCDVVNSGRVFSVDLDGQVLWDVGTKVTHKGSFETSIRISSDGFRVTLEGNVGRFNRQDNVFGYSVFECVILANDILAEYGLPPFSEGQIVARASRAVRLVDAESFAKAGQFGREMNADGKEYFLTREDQGGIATGAVITRVDLTCNYVTGSDGNASQYIRHLQGFKSGKFEPRPYYTTGVSWGEGSKYWYAKVYDKAADYLRHRSEASVLHDAPLYAWLKSNGVVRHEITLKSRYLSQNNLWRIMNWGPGMATESRVYALFSDALTASANVDEFLEIPGRAGELAVAWRDGADLKKRLSHRTFYRYRKELLLYGIDISLQSNVQRLRIKVEIIKVAPASMPHFYVLPKVA